MGSEIVSHKTALSADSARAALPSSAPGSYEPPAVKDWGPVELMTLAGGGANPDASTTTGSAGGGLT